MLEGLSTVGNTKERKAQNQKENNELKKLKSDLHRKDKALAEVSALKEKQTCSGGRRGRLISAQDKAEASLIGEACSAGARTKPAWRFWKSA